MRTHLLSRVVLNLQLHARALPSNDKPTQNPSQHPDLPVLTDDDTLRVDPPRKEVGQGIGLHDVHAPTSSDEAPLPAPGDADGAADFVAHAREAVREGYGGGGGGGRGEAEEEGCLAAFCLVVGWREQGDAWDAWGAWGWDWVRVRDWVREDGVGGGEAGCLEESLGVQECGGCGVVAGGELWMGSNHNYKKGDSIGYILYGGWVGTLYREELDHDDTHPEPSIGSRFDLHLA
jgi:hypothetical protein